MFSDWFLCQGYLLNGKTTFFRNLAVLWRWEKKNVFFFFLFFFVLFCFLFCSLSSGCVRFCTVQTIEQVILNLDYHGILVNIIFRSWKSRAPKRATLLQSTRVISNLTAPDNKFELSVVRDNQSVTSHAWRSQLFALMCLEHMYGYSVVKTFACTANCVVIICFRMSNDARGSETSINDQKG